jgi:hypothetical protein
MAGYSGTPLIKKLGIKDNFRVAIINSPLGFRAELGALPVGAIELIRPGKAMDFVLLFSKSAATLKRDFARLSKSLTPAGMLWIAWPKKSSGVASDLTENVIRGIGLDGGLVDVKVCAVNDVWSGLKFVYRLRDRDRLLN